MYIRHIQKQISILSFLLQNDLLFLDSINNINMICNDYDIFKESSTHFSSPVNVLFKHAGSEMSNENAFKVINIQFRSNSILYEPCIVISQNYCFFQKGLYLVINE